MELSVLCNVKVLMCVIDRNSKMMIYNTDKLTPFTMLEHFNNKFVEKEYCTNEHVKNNFKNKL
jgi:hypothetical protein